MSPNSLPAALRGAAFAASALTGSDVPRWQPGQGGGALHGEIFAPGKEAGGSGLALALVLDALRAQLGDPDDRRGVLWVQDQRAIALSGRPYRPGLPAPLRDRLVHVAAKSCEDALFALEEGLRCRDLCCVIGEIAGNPRALDFTASRRLSLAVERHDIPLYLVRLDAARDLSSARMRWQAHSAASLPPRWNAAAPGAPSWQAQLFRSRLHAPGEWILRDDAQQLSAEHKLSATPPDHGDLAGQAGGGSLAAR